MRRPPGGGLVVDSSALVALLADPGREGAWVAGELSGMALSAPHLALFEAANVLRRMESDRRLDPTQAALAHDDLLALPLRLCEYEPLGPRAWELRHDLSIYDASYVALAELLGTPLVTLDARIARAGGVRCPVLTPPASSA